MSALLTGDLLRRPTWTDAMIGVGWAWFFFSVSTAVVTGVVTVVMAPTVMTLPSAVLVGTFALVFSGFAGAFVALLWALPLGMLVAKALARVADWRIVAAAQFGLGAVTGFLVTLLGTGATFPEWFWPVAAGFTAIAGASAAAGWVLTWRRSTRRAGRAGRPA